MVLKDNKLFFFRKKALPFILQCTEEAFAANEKKFYSIVTAVPAAVTISMEPLPPTVS